MGGGEGTPFEPRPGRVMREWLEVPPSGGERWIALAKEAQTFVAAGR